VGASTDHRLGSAAVRAGARDYFALPTDLDALRRTLEREGRERRGAREGGRFAAAERAASGFAAIVGSSEPMRRALDQARRVTQHGGVTVLITGETGTGKELLARAIHYEGPRAAGPFVEINCAAIPPGLLESELFGHEKGAFTGAVAAKPGLFEMAHGGTLFLDEIGTMPIELQAKLLRALESREIRRVGGQRSHRIEVRVIAATHGDLRGAISRGEFREDLFYRLNVVSLSLPPLRERMQDVEQLAAVFLERLAGTYGLPVPPLTPALRAALHAHPWPGNVRELRNTIERGLVLSPRGALDAESLFGSDLPAAAPATSALPFPADLAAITRAAAHAMVEFTGGNKSEAARRLGISRPRLNRLLDDPTP
jgi:DNA-binding NtrC family response regulator